jgi:serine/threonine-protein kinase RsbW
VNSNHRALLVDGNAKGGEAPQRTLAVEAFRKIMNDRASLGQSADHCQAVADGLIAWHGYNPFDSSGRCDLTSVRINHGLRLAWSLTFQKTSCNTGSMDPYTHRRFELTIPSRLEEMTAVSNLIAEAIKEYNLDEETAHWIELTVSESMINAIQHGNKADPAKKATLKIASNGETIEIIVEDQGSGFSVDNVADPTDMANLLKPCGRGILIIRSYMDEVDVSQREGGGCRLRMVKKLSGNNCQ